jgi:hypothetical protein
MGTRGPYVSATEQVLRVQKLKRALRDQKAGRIGPARADLYRAVGLGRETVRKLARENDIDLRK